MKNKHLFIGIDIAKLTFEAVFIQSTAISSTGSKSFTNDKKGFRELIKWIKNINPHQQEWVFCFEHTGIYAFHFCCFLEDNNLDYCYESALKTNRSLGIIKRQKSDQADAIDIAKYLYQKRDDLEYYKLPSRSVQKLKALISLRRRMLKQKIRMSVSSSEIVAFSDKQTARIIKQESNKIINKFEKQIEKIDEQIVNLMNADPEFSEKYNLTIVKSNSNE